MKSCTIFPAMQHQLPKGTFDILPYEPKEAWQLSEIWQFVEKTIRDLCKDYDYLEIRTPIYEMTQLFDRGVGETSDIVTKEMFTFKDKGDRSLTLRPEGTAAVMRSFIENHLANFKSSHKLFYIGPMFRYERPQSGRYRQHHQFGVEAIGNKGPEQDAEIIDLLLEFYKRLGIKNLSLHLNTVGDLESRNRYKSALIDYLKPFFNDLSEDSQTRFEKNPLRILDSKAPKDKEIIKGAPSILNFLTDDAKRHFETLCNLLEKIHIAYKIDDKIVRGLDYYNQTVFEVITTELGAQNTIGAGGRFDGLIKTLGGPDVAAVGFATGLERVIQVCLAQNTYSFEKEKDLVYFIPMGEEAKQKCFELATECRRNRISASIELNAKKVPQAIQNASKNRAKFCAVIGSEELEKNCLQLKNLITREQKEICLDHMIQEIFNV